MPDSTPIIEVVGVTKRYGEITAVDHLNLNIPQGVCFGLLGPNGAGKTTLIEIIEDIISPTSGQVRYQGRERTPSFREHIGIMFQHTSMLTFMTVHETLATFQALYSRTRSIDELIRLCHLEEIRGQYNDKISGGQRQRLMLALALINQPDLLFLDEPSTGLDPQARRNLWDIVNTVKGQGKTIVLTTHYMEEAQQLCDEVAIMDHGKIIVQGPPNDLITRYGGGMNLRIPKKSLAVAGDSIPYPVTDVEDHVQIQVEDINAAIAVLLNAGVDLTQMEAQTPNLETVFLNLTGKLLRD